jgi:hemerythrin
MGIKFIWEDKYSVGNAKIDKQHKGFFELGNQIPDISNAKEIRPIIRQLYQYTIEHFSSEEKMMKSIGFPLLEEHVLLHEELISQLNNISTHPFDTTNSIHTFKKFIYDWLINHILHEDNKYFLFTQNKA